MVSSCVSNSSFGLPRHQGLGAIANFALSEGYTTDCFLESRAMTKMAAIILPVEGAILHDTHFAKYISIYWI